MRELTMDELEQVSGGDITDSLQYWGAAAAIGQFTYGSTWATFGVLAAFGTPLAALTIIGLAFAGGYVYLNE